MALLEAKELTKSFGGLWAVNKLNFKIDEGDIVGLIGPNGAGKTTVFNLVTGFIRPNRGRVFFRGLEITGLRPSKIVAKGIARTFQLSTFFSEMTVLENLLVALHLQANQLAPIPYQFIKTQYIRQKEKEIYRSASDLMDFVGLIFYENEKAKNLPHGLQRLLSIAIVLASNPHILLLDEVTSGMNAEEVNSTLGLLREIHRRGKTLLLIEHNMRVAMSLCDRVIVLNYGKKIAEGTPEEISNNEQVISAYLGTGKEFA